MSLSALRPVLRTCQEHPFAVGSLLFLLETILIAAVYTPFWQSYDDVALAMFIKGYGMAERPSINLLYCNFIWASLVQQIPDFLDVSGYTWALYFLTGLSLLAIWHVQTADKTLRLLKFAVCSSMLFYAFLNPQYTVTALYCGIAASSLFLLYQRKGSWSLIAGCLFFAFFSFILREWAPFFIALPCLSLVNWRSFLADRRLLLISACFCLVLAAVYIANDSLKSGPQWQEIKAWNKARQSLTDAHMSDIYRMQPDLLARYGYTVNDMWLLGTHFGLAGELMDPARINSLKKESRFDIYLDYNLEKVEDTFDFFFSWPVVLLLLVSVILLIGRISWPAGAALLILGALFFCVGFFNRGGVWISRVYYPSLYALNLWLLLQSPSRRFARDIYISSRLATAISAGLLAISILAFGKANIVERIEREGSDIEQARALLNGSVWYGHPARLEWLYPPFGSDEEARKIKFQSAAWTSLIPESRLYVSPGDLDNSLEKGFTICASPGQAEYLGSYCREHLAGIPETTLLNSDRNLRFYRVRCMAPE